MSSESLTGPHQSVLRNPLIAQAFNRTGAVETWGRGTNRVVEICRENGVELPVCDLQGNSFLVTFRATMVPTPIQRPQFTPQVTPVVRGRARVWSSRVRSLCIHGVSSLPVHVHFRPSCVFGL
ncbi:MAG: ATP-binding protein [Planctomycetaceae bacterium]